jgi:hypothetical protein
MTLMSGLDGLDGIWLVLIGRFAIPSLQKVFSFFFLLPFSFSLSLSLTFEDLGLG